MLARSTRSGAGAHIGSTPTSGLLPGRSDSPGAPLGVPGPSGPRTTLPPTGRPIPAAAGNAARAAAVRFGHVAGNHVSEGLMATSTWRRWLRPPQLRTLDAQDERHATW